MASRESGAVAPAEPVEVQLSRQMSLLLAPTDGETLPPLSHEDEYYVVRVYPSGVKRTVVERKDNILSRDEALQHEKAARYYDETAGGRDEPRGLGPGPGTWARVLGPGPGSGPRPRARVLDLGPRTRGPIEAAATSKGLSS